MKANTLYAPLNLASFVSNNGSITASSPPPPFPIVCVFLSMCLWSHDREIELEGRLLISVVDAHQLQKFLSWSDIRINFQIYIIIFSTTFLSHVTMFLAVVTCSCVCVFLSMCLWSVCSKRSS